MSRRDESLLLLALIVIAARKRSSSGPWVPVPPLLPELQIPVQPHVPPNPLEPLK